MLRIYMKKIHLAIDACGTWRGSMSGRVDNLCLNLNKLRQRKIGCNTNHKQPHSKHMFCRNYYLG